MTSPFVTVPSFTVARARAARHQALATNQTAILQTLKPLCVVQRTAAQTLSNATLTAISYTATDVYDPLAVHDPSSNPSQIVAPYDGWYSFHGQLVFASNVTGARECFLRVGGANDVSGSSVIREAASSEVTVPISPRPALLTAGQYVEVFAFQSSGGDLNVGLGAGSPLYYPTLTVYYHG